MDLHMSYKLKLEILNAVKKRNIMFAKWIDLCSTIAFILLAVLALINATSLKENVFGSNTYMFDIVTIFTIIVSICFDFIFKSDKYKENVFIVNKIIEISYDVDVFDDEFKRITSMIKEIDVARARYDYCSSLQAENCLNVQAIDDRLRPVDLITMNRERYTIIAVILEIILFVGMLVYMHSYPILLYIIPAVMLLVGVIFMLIDAIGGHFAKKKVSKIYRCLKEKNK